MNQEFFGLLDKMLKEGYVVTQKHPEADFHIYNYSPKAQYERIWNEVTLQCRGLILDGKRNVIARPLVKFFNMEELEANQIPDESFEVYEKMDGSLGILYFLEGTPFFATRGSFISEQSQKATKMLLNQYNHAIPFLDRSKTYLFEIIYPENRIVVDYGDKEELILLAIINKETGEDFPLEDLGFPIVKKYSGATDLGKLKAFEEENREGYIIRFKNGFRMKVKFEEYVRLHRILTNISNLSVWEYLSAGMPFTDILERVPDEFYQWVKQTKAGLEKEFSKVESICKNEYKNLGSRKENALYYQTCTYPSILFKMLDKKDYSDIIWKVVRPVYQKPFSNRNVKLD